MYAMKSLILAGGTLALIAGMAVAQDAPAPAAGRAAAARPAPRQMPTAWVPKMTPLSQYDATNKPVAHLSEIRASHSKTASWDMAIVRNKEMWADWHQLAAGASTPRVMFPDNRTGLIVWDGQVRVTVDGQEPFVASKGFEINIPYRTPYKLETVGSAPALYFQVRESDHLPLYPVDTNPEKPKDPAGYKYVKAMLTADVGKIDAGQKPYLDYYKDVIAANGRGGAFIASDHFFMNNIRGMGVPTPPPTNLGHFHAEYTEFWFILEGKMEYLIEGIPDVVQADAGDVVIAAPGRFHRASFKAGQMDTRVAINPFPQGEHNFTVTSGGTQ